MRCSSEYKKARKKTRTQVAKTCKNCGKRIEKGVLVPKGRINYKFFCCKKCRETYEKNLKLLNNLAELDALVPIQIKLRTQKQLNILKRYKFRNYNDLICDLIKSKENKNE